MGQLTTAKPAPFEARATEPELPSAPEPIVEVEAVEPPPPAKPPVEVSVPQATRPTPAAERELGKGGQKHRYLQNLVKGLAEQHGFRATIEAPISGGQVDALLVRDELSIAVEVSVSTPVEWERQNLRKCLDGGFSRVVLVLAKSEKTARTYRERVVEGLSEEERDRLTLLYPDDLPDFFASLAPAEEPLGSVVKGYRVKVSQTTVSPDEAKARRDTLARLVAQSLRQQSD